MAAEINMTIPQQIGMTDRIYPPVIDVRYASRRTEDLDITTESLWTPQGRILEDKQHEKTKSLAPEVPTKFTVNYTCDLSAFWRWATVLLVSFLACAIVTSSFRIYSFSKRHQSFGVDGATLFKALIYLLGTAADWMFSLIVILSFYWLFFFKFQATVFWLLPSDEELKPFVVMLIVSFIFKCIELIEKIVVIVSRRMF